jgi:antitoxin HicB
MVMKNKNLNYYLSLPWTYTIETTQDENGNSLYIVSVNELPGVQTDASSIQEAMELIQDAMKGAFKLYMKHGEEIPEPISEDDYKGNIAYRTTSRRHYILAREARKRNQSLSKIIDECIDYSLVGKINTN